MQPIFMLTVVGGLFMMIHRVLDLLSPFAKIAVAVASISGCLCRSIGSDSDNGIRGSFSRGTVFGAWTSARIVLPVHQLRLGTPVVFTLRITNRKTWPADYWVTEYCLTHLIVVRDSRGIEPPLTAEGLYWRGQFGIPNRRAHVPVELKPGESYLDDPGKGLDELYVLKPGRYTVQITYSDSNPSDLRWLLTPATSFEIINN
jgi:hypothetical protein